MRERESIIVRFFGGLRAFFSFIMLLALIPIVTGWMGESVKKLMLLQDISARELYLLAIGSLLIVLFAAWFLITSKRLLPTRILQQDPLPSRRRVVIALISDCTNLRLDRDTGEWKVCERYGDPGEWTGLGGRSLDELVASGARDIPQWSWQQTLRAAHYHDRDNGPLDKLVLIGSTGRRGSASPGQLGLAVRFFSQWFPEKVIAYGLVCGDAHGDGDTVDDNWHADFEDLFSLRTTLLRTIDALKSDSGYRDEDIVIDCTGGYKVTSIAAALVTLDRQDLIFQYVGTGPHAGQVTGFQLANETYAS